MEIFIKASAAILIAAIFSVILAKNGKDISILLSLSVCCMVLLLAGTYLRPVLDFVMNLTNLGELKPELINALLKITGIGMISQIVTLVCMDAGNQTLAKALQIMTSALILCLSIPLLEEMLSLIESVLGSI